MDLKLKIETQTEYASAMRRMSNLMQAKPGTPEMDELEILADVIEDYEIVHFPIGDPTPEALAQHLLEASISDFDDVGDPYVQSLSPYAGSVNHKALETIVKFCGIALKGQDSKYVSMTDDAEVTRVVNGFAAKKLGIDESNARTALKVVNERMKAEKRKLRTTVYYLLAEQTGSLSKLM